MDWIKNMNCVMNYIDENIAKELDVAEIARMTGCSSNHFQRIFTFITGVSLSEYIRRRRLTFAALELQESKIKIIDLAMKYGYDSPDSFTRAFQKIHGITPTLARTTDLKLKSYPKMTFNFSINGKKPLSYKIMQKDGFELIGKGIMLTTDNMTEDIQNFWQECYSNGTCRKLYELSEGELLFDVVAYREEADSRVSFHIAYQNKSNSAEVTKEFELLRIPPLTWVVFTLDEPISVLGLPMDDATQHTEILWNKAYNEWFPTSGYIDGTPIVEVFYSDKVELWIPVEKK